MARFLALLRGVNVGGRNRLPMAELRALLATAGGERVRTHLQSGNALFDAAAGAAPAVARRLEAALRDGPGLECPVLLRSVVELGRAMEASPFLETEGPEHLHLAFLRDRPEAASVRALDPERSPGDSFAVIGKEVHLHCPNGLARTKLTSAWLDRALATTSTTRNWRTLTALLRLAES